MNKESFDTDLEFDETRVKTKVILETSFSKEIRILLKAGQVMKEHKSAFPITIHILQGIVDIGVQGETARMIAGDILALEGTILHDLKAIENSIVRLTISKQDTIKRLDDVIHA